MRGEPPVEVTWVKRPEPEPPEDRARVEQVVREILDSIRERGDEAVREHSRRLDGWDPERFRVDRATIDQAYVEVGEEGVAEIGFLRDQVRAFAEAQLAALAPVETRPHPGIVLGHRLVPVRAVGCYVPGGHYPLIASVHMQVVAARVAGVERVAACAPPRAGVGIWPATLVAMDVCGADEVYAIGGVQALAALAYGTSEIEPVEMITGPGNQFVAEAKRQLFGVVGIDLLAGPTEILVLADESADAELVACDLLGQAEHGPNSPAHLVTDSRELAEAVAAAVAEQLPLLESREILERSWGALGAIAVVAGPDELVAYADWFAPEHLEVMTADPDWYHDRLRNYGTIFLGAHSTVAYSDKAIGTNHILPTAGAARYTGPLWPGVFVRLLTYEKLTDEGSAFIAPHAARIARLEGMHAHAATCERRLDRIRIGS